MSETAELEMISKEALDALAHEAEQATLGRHIQEGEKWLAAKEQVAHVRERLLKAAADYFASPSGTHGHELHHVAHLMVQALDHLDAVERSYEVADQMLAARGGAQ